ncbi:hypothetical protein FQN54_004503 [Arachnomyces sp. PD_36]|nr:hypothetical protein FQN54_004503 [Arachnomyces sp. PD_36]
MASGTAYRWTEPARYALNLYSSEHPEALEGETKLYKAPPVQLSDRKQPPSASRLGEIPLELLHQVLLDLDLHSLGMLRRVNSTMRCLVESLLEYSVLRNHASHTLRVMDATKCTASFPVRRLFQELSQPYCRTCSDFGPYLYLPTLTRSCFNCNMYRPEYQVAPTPDVMLHFGISGKDLKSIPILYPLRDNKHHMDDVVECSKQRMVDVAQARELGLRINGSLEKMKKDFRIRRNKHRDKEKTARLKWKEDIRTGRSERREPGYRSIPGNLTNSWEASEWRMLGTTSFPYWDRHTGLSEPGVYCRACTYQFEERGGRGRQSCQPWGRGRGKRAYDRAFLQAQLPEHFRRCSAVKEDYNFHKREGPIEWPWRRTGTDFTVDATGAVVKEKALKHDDKNGKRRIKGRRGKGK